MPAHAQEGTVLSTARDLAQQGLNAYGKREYEQALDKLTQAYAIVRVPTLAVVKARTLVRLGKLVAASELYLEAIRLEKADFWQSTQFEAQRDAERERNELLPRIPRLKISIDGAKAGEVSVSLNGVVLPSSMLGIEAMVDPGETKVVGNRGREVVQQTVSLKEGTQNEVILRFTSVVFSAVSRKSPTESGPGAVARAEQTFQVTPPNWPDSNLALSSQALFGWIILGVGGAGMAVGTVTGLVALSNRPPGCQGTHCPQIESDKVSSFNRLLDVSTVGFVAGGLAAAAGVTLLLTAPKQSSQPRVGLWLNHNSVRLGGSF